MVSKVVPLDSGAKLVKGQPSIFALNLGSQVNKQLLVYVARTWAADLRGLLRSWRSLAGHKPAPVGHALCELRKKVNYGVCAGLVLVQQAVVLP